MTTAIASNIINNLTELPAAAESAMDSAGKFEQIFDKTMTLGDIKEALHKDIDESADFKEIVQQALSEANVETSLDLTLSRDITEIIADLKKTVDDEPDIDIDEEIAPVQVQTVEFQQLLTLNSEPAQTEEIVQSMQNQAEEIIKPVEKSAEETTADAEPAINDDMLQELNIESVDVQSETSGEGSSLMNQQSPQEQAVKVMINHDVDSFDVKFQSKPAVEVSKPVSVTPEKLIEQITKQMESLQNNSKVNIVLNPESLGKVTIQLVKSPEGLSAQFTTATQEARDLLMKGLDGLKETLTAHGVGVDNVSVKVSDTQKSEYNSDWTEQEGSRGGNKEQGQPQKEEKEKGLFEKMMAQQNEKK